MKKILVLSLVLFIGAFALWQDAPAGSAVSNKETQAVWGGCIREINSSVQHYVCYGGCAGGGCGCTQLLKAFEDGETGGSWDDAKKCGTTASAYCTAVQSQSGTCSNGG